MTLTITHAKVDAIADNAADAAAGKVLPSDWNADHVVTGTADGGRTQLTVDTTYYVATTGNDTTGDGSVGLPWATIQHAVNYVMYNVTGQGVNVSIQVADGTYAEQLLLGPHQIFAPNGGYGSAAIYFSSATTPANLTLAPTTSTFNEFGIIQVMNSSWQIGGGLSFTFGASGAFCPIAVVNGGHLYLGTDSTLTPGDIGIIVTDAGTCFLDVENNSSFSIGASTASTVEIQSTFACWILSDQSSDIHFYPRVNVDFAVDPGFAGSAPFCNGMFAIGLGNAGNCNVILRNTWSGAAAASSGISDIKHYSRLIDENQYQALSKYKIDDSSWYNNNIGNAASTIVARFVNKGQVFTGFVLEGLSGSPVPYDTWEFDISPPGVYGGTGNFLLFNDDANTEPLLISSTGQIATFATGLFGWSSDAAFAESAVPDTGLSRISPAVAGLGNGTQGDVSGTLECAGITSASFSFKNGSTLVWDLNVSFGSNTLTHNANVLIYDPTNAGVSAQLIFWETLTSIATTIQQAGTAIVGLAQNTGELQLQNGVGSGPNALIVGDVANFSHSLAIESYAVAALPPAPVAGQLAAVNDALVPVVGNAVGAGGAAFAMVCYNGAVWKVFVV